MKKRDNFCAECDVKLDVIKEGYKIVSIKDMIKFEEADQNEKVIECVGIQLCECSVCGKQANIDEGEFWLSKSEIRDAMLEHKIFSENPELHILFRLLIDFSMKK